MAQIRMTQALMPAMRTAVRWMAGARRLMVALVAAMALGGLHLAHAEATGFDPARDAKADVAAAVARARSEGKHVLVDVGGEWCVWCHLLDGFFDGDAEARALRERDYVLVKVNWSPQNHNAALLARWPKIHGYPHLFVLDGNGRLVHSQRTDALERGRGYDRDKVNAFLRRYAPRAGATHALLLPFAGSSGCPMPLA